MSFRLFLIAIGLLTVAEAYVQRSIFIPKIIIENCNCSDVKTLEFSTAETPIAVDKNICYPVDKHDNSTHSSHVAIVIQNPPMIMRDSPKDNSYEIGLTLHMSDRTYHNSFKLEIGAPLSTQVVNFTSTAKAYILAPITGMVLSTVFEEGHAALAIAIIETVVIVGVLLAIVIVKLAIPAYRRRHEDNQFNHQTFGNDYSDTPSMLRREGYSDDA